jgi:hypothetical protein
MTLWVSGCRSGACLHRNGENIMILLIIYAHNAAALRPGTLARLPGPVHFSRRNWRKTFAD